MIPKQIFQIWISDKPIPEKFKKFTDTWAVNKGFKIIEVTTCDYDSPFLKWAKERNAHTLINHYLRCKLLYEFGGVYLDLDIECLKDLTPLLNAPFTVGIEDSEVVNNAVIIAEKGHPFLRWCMGYMDRFEFTEKEVELETGPRMFTRMADEWGWRVGRIGQFTHTIPHIRILAPEYFYPYHYTETYDPQFITDKTYCVHHWAHSWGDLVSIVIPCYKQAQYLPDAIESALKQSYKNIEVIVVNDGSPDNTSDVAKKYPGVILVEQTNKGLSGARNTGIKASKGKWIVTLDSDDKLHTDFISKTIGKADIVGCWLQCFGKSRDVWKPPLKNPVYSDFLKRNYLFCCSIFKREVWENCGGYDEEQFTHGKQGCHGWEDFNFWLRATKINYKIDVVPQVLFYYRKHEHSMHSDSIKNKKRIIDYMRIEHPQLQYY